MIKDHISQNIMPRKYFFESLITVPGEVENLQIIRKDFHRIELIWQKPKTPNGELTRYTVTYQGTKFLPTIQKVVLTKKVFKNNSPYFSAINPLIFKTGSKSSFPATENTACLENLAAQTEYRISVSAENRIGKSDDVIILETTLTDEGKDFNRM